MGQPPELKTSLRPDRAGFTILETLTALMVMGIALSIFLALFRASVTMMQDSRGDRVAASIAEEQLGLILVRPGSYDWAGFEDLAAGERHHLATLESAEPPLAMPTQERLYHREKNLYENCAWEAYARAPSAEAGYVEISVHVLWSLDGRDRRFVLTSCLPRNQARNTG